jgi:hypothetical protein
LGKYRYPRRTLKKVASALRAASDVSPRVSPTNDQNASLSELVGMVIGHRVAGIAGIARDTRVVRQVRVPVHAWGCDQCSIAPLPAAGRNNPSAVIRTSRLHWTIEGDAVVEAIRLGERTYIVKKLLL